MNNTIKYPNRHIESRAYYTKAIALSEPSILITLSPNHYIQPYFSIYNNTNYRDATKVARLHFLDDQREYLNESSVIIDVTDWDINEKENEEIHNILNMKDPIYEKFTNWQLICFEWNWEFPEFYNNNFVKSIDSYISGEYDNDPDFCNHPSYVPSTAPIPKLWMYNPPEKLKGD